MHRCWCGCCAVQYWMPTSNSTPFDIDYFCYKERGGGPCRKFTKEATKR